jgi:hypothetical protein
MRNSMCMYPKPIMLDLFHQMTDACESLPRTLFETLETHDRMTRVVWVHGHSGPAAAAIQSRQSMQAMYGKKARRQRQTSFLAR